MRFIHSVIPATAGKRMRGWLKAAPAFLDHCKFITLWIGEWLAYAAIPLLILQAVKDFTAGQPAHGLLALIGSLLIICLCILINFSQNPHDNAKK